MKNIIVTLDDHLYRKSRITAAQADTTVTALYSEDFNHAQNYGGVTVINPFL